MTRFRGIRGLIGKRPDGVEGRTELESLFILESCTGAARGSDPQMTFYECKFLIKLKVGLQIRNEAKFSSFVGAVSFPPP